MVKHACGRSYQNGENSLLHHEKTKHGVLTKRQSQPCPKTRRFKRTKTWFEKFCFVFLSWCVDCSSFDRLHFKIEHERITWHCYSKRHAVVHTHTVTTSWSFEPSLSTGADTFSALIIHLRVREMTAFMTACVCACVTLNGCSVSKISHQIVDWFIETQKVNVGWTVTTSSRLMIVSSDL